MQTEEMCGRVVEGRNVRCRKVASRMWMTPEISRACGLKIPKVAHPVRKHLPVTTEQFSFPTVLSTAEYSRKDESRSALHNTFIDNVGGHENARLVLFGSRHGCSNVYPRSTKEHDRPFAGVQCEKYAFGANRRGRID